MHIDLADARSDTFQVIAKRHHAALHRTDASLRSEEQAASLCTLGLAVLPPVARYLDAAPHGRFLHQAISERCGAGRPTELSVLLEPMAEAPDRRATARSRTPSDAGAANVQVFAALGEEVDTSLVLGWAPVDPVDLAREQFGKHLWQPVRELRPGSR